MIGRDGVPRGAFSLTFDNLGEAAELELGLWPEERPVGAHPTVMQTLPRLLDLLEVRATFFVEAWNCATYPDAIREIVTRGHEVALHGWRHEFWSRLEPTRERELLERGVEAMGELGIAPVGFRPPGGAINPCTEELLLSLGFDYTSEEGERAGRTERLASLPFRWELVDAFHFDPILGGLREDRGLGRDPLPLEHWGRALDLALDEAAESRSWRCAIFHPYLLDRDERLDVLSAFVERLRARDDIEVAPCREVSATL